MDRACPNKCLILSSIAAQPGVLCQTMCGAFAVRRALLRDFMFHDDSWVGRSLFELAVVRSPSNVS